MVLLIGTGCSHGCHIGMWPHVLRYSLLVFSGCLICQQIYDVVQEAGRQTRTFSRYRWITIGLIRPRLLSEIRRHWPGDDLPWIRCDCRTASMPVLEYCHASFPTVWQTTCMRSLLTTYDVPKKFEFRQGCLYVGSAPVVNYCDYFYPVRQCELLEAVKYIFPTYPR